MKVDICCIARREEMTIVDWVEYHRRLGINHIYIFDNNDVDDFSMNLLLKPYIDIGYVSLFTIFKGKQAKQIEAYNISIQEINKSGLTNWTAFIDCDEYLVLNGKYKTFSDFFNEVEEKCPDIGVLYVNWICYTASKNILYEPRPVVERFTERLNDLKVNNHVKSIVKGGCHAGFYLPHNAKIIDGKKIYNMNFKEADCSPFQTFTEGQSLYINHYVTKSVQEYVYRKYGKGTADAIGQNYYNFDYFLQHNNNDREYYEKPFNDFIKLYNNGQN